MSAPDPGGARGRLEREARVLARAIAGVEADRALIEDYRRAHELGVVEPPGGSGAFSRWLVGLARLGPLWARAADAHAALFERGGLLRRKLTLVLALLESRHPTDRAVDGSPERPPAAVAAGALARVGLFALLVALGSAPLLLARLASALLLRGGRAR